MTGWAITDQERAWWQRRAGFDRHYGFHQLRHSAVTNVYRASRDLFLAQILDEGERATLPLRKSRRGWLQVVRGAIEANGSRLKAGDGAAIRDETALTVTGKSKNAEILAFDLP